MQNLEPFETNCTDSSWKKTITELKNTTVDLKGGVGLRQWIYQTCSQFGYCKLFKLYERPIEY